jgi:hypothetical protein
MTSPKRSLVEKKNQTRYLSIVDRNNNVYSISPNDAASLAGLESIDGCWCLGLD